MNGLCRHSIYSIFYLHRSWPPVICMQQCGSGQAADRLPTNGRGEHGNGSTGHWGGGGIVAYLHASWYTHGNDVVHICAESWDALVVKYGVKVKIFQNDVT